MAIALPHGEAKKLQKLLMKKFNHTGRCDDRHICGWLGVLKESFLFFLVMHLGEITGSHFIFRYRKDAVSARKN